MLPKNRSNMLLLVSVVVSETCAPCLINCVA